MLRNIGDDPDVRMYYTVDGSRPTINSPEFTEEGILIPAGRIRLRAIAVSQYGKESNELQIEYKVQGKTENISAAKIPQPLWLLWSMIIKNLLSASAVL